MSKVVVVGELLVDLISNTYVDELSRAESFNRFFAGSPGNLVSNLKDLGISSTPLARVGADSFGRAYISILEKRGIDASFVQLDENFPTSFVVLSRSNSNPQFIALRGADYMLSLPENTTDLLNGAQYLHLTAWPLSRQPARDTAIKLVQEALSRDIKVFLDPNYREKLWERGESGRDFMQKFLKCVDTVKPSADDALHLFGKMEHLEYIETFHSAGAKNVVLTLGGEGAIVSDGRRLEKLPAFARRVVDTTGAGDAFWAGLYRGLTEGKSIFESALYGSYCGAFRVEHEGKNVLLPSLEALKAMYERGG